MTPYRTRIAEAFRAVLLDKTSAGKRVLTKLDKPLNPEDTPAVMVYANEARRGDPDYGNSVVPRVVRVTIEAAVQSTPADALDAADLLADAIEAAIEADATLGGVVQDTRWDRTLTDTTSIGQRTIGVCLLQYDVDMLTENRQPYPFDDDGAGLPRVVHTLPDTHGADLFGTTLTPEFDCGPEGCAPDAWGGEVKPNGEAVP